jgi:hypothetical protein
MQETKPSNIHVTLLKGQWTEESSQRSVRSWLKLTTSQKAAIDVVGAQDDSMAMGARKDFQELSESDQERWLKLPFTGCDGLPKTGQAWVRSGILTAAVYVPPSRGVRSRQSFSKKSHCRAHPHHRRLHPIFARIKVSANTSSTSRTTSVASLGLCAGTRAVPQRLALACVARLRSRAQTPLEPHRASKLCEAGPRRARQ